MLLIFFSIKILAAQKGEIKGFVYNENNGDRIEGVVILIKSLNRQVITDREGFYSFPQLPFGDYTVETFSSEYETSLFTIKLKELNFKQDFYLMDVKLKTIQINAKKSTITGPPVTVIEGKKIKEMPSVGSEPDLVQYLQSMPGVIFSGDQGGQLYIRGGSPIMNKISIDGLPIYNALHSIGLFSVFDVDLINTADVYSAGFAAEYGGRIGAIINVNTRNGNTNKFAGRVTASTFASKILLEGPIKKFSKGQSNSSFAVSYRNSYLRQSSQIVYSYIPKGTIPYNFGDLFTKFTINNNNGGFLKLLGFRFGDNVNFPNSTSYNWRNIGLGGKFLLVPQYSKTQIDGFFMYSKYVIEQKEILNKPRTSGIGGISLGLNFAFNFIRDKIKWGIDINGFKTEYSLYNLSNRYIAEIQSTTELNGYATYFLKRKKFLAEIGTRIQYYASLGNTSVEPRLNCSYKLSSQVNFYAAAGMYSQNLMSAVSDRDVVNLFYGFLSGPENLPTEFDGKSVNHKLQKAKHLTGGVEFNPSRGWSFKTEAFYKIFDQITNINRDKLFEDEPIHADKPDRLKQDFLIENGDAYGGDFTLNYTNKKINVGINYSLTYVNRFDGVTKYQPTFDRRHNGNVNANLKIGKKNPISIGIRWSIGSGFPFTQTSGIYEKFDFANGIDQDYVNKQGKLGILYDKINGGRLPYYHRLDASVSRDFKFSKTKKMNINLSVTNVYNRENIFYFNRVLFKRVNQLPIIPSIGMGYDF